MATEKIFDKISGISTTSGFKYQAELPLDARLVVESENDLTDLVDEHGAYDGMLVYVKADKKYYSYSISDSTGTWTEFKGTDTSVTPGDGTLTIKRNGTQIGTFTANQSTASEVNIIVPTGSAASKDVDTTLDLESTSTNLPTSAAVASLVKSTGLIDGEGNKIDLSKYALSDNTITAGSGLTVTNEGKIGNNPTLHVGQGSGITVSDDLVSARAGNGINVDTNGIHHKIPESIGTALQATDRKYVSGITFDNFGHVTSLTAEAVTNSTSKNIVGAANNATANAVATNGNVYLNHLENSTVTSTHKISGAGAITVTSDANGNITINTIGYLGTINATTGLSKTAKAGDFYRVSAPFDVPLTSDTGSNKERAHLGDILIAIVDNPQQQNLSCWDILHADAGVTGVQLLGSGNAFTDAGLSDGVLTLNKGTSFATKTEVASLISHGTADPTSNINTTYYFKY